MPGSKRRRSWDLTERDKEVLLEDEHRLLRWLCIFDYPMSGQNMSNRLPRWPGRTLRVLLEKGLVRCLADARKKALTDKYEPTLDGRNLVTVLKVMES